MSIKLVTRSVWHNPGNQGQRLLRMLAAVKWQLHKRILKSPRLLQLASGKSFRAYPDCVVSSALIYADFPEYEEFTFVRSHLNASDSVIDIGANVGHVGLLLSDVVDSAEIYAFEPTPLTFARLKENWSLNPSSNPPHLYQLAVGNCVGEVLMPDQQDPNTMNSIITAEKAGESGIRTVAVPITSLDAMSETWKGKSVGLLKIDVEGHEDAVFDGARNFIATHRPRLIMFESLTGSLSPTVASVLAASKFDVFQLENGKPDFGHQTAQNLFACPHEESQRLGRGA